MGISGNFLNSNFFANERKTTGEGALSFVFKENYNKRKKNSKSNYRILRFFMGKFRNLAVIPNLTQGRTEKLGFVRGLEKTNLKFIENERKIRFKLHT